jgi:hypothetical protein
VTSASVVIEIKRESSLSTNLASYRDGLVEDLCHMALTNRYVLYAHSPHSPPTLTWRVGVLRFEKLALAPDPPFLSATVESAGTIHLEKLASCAFSITAAEDGTLTALRRVLQEAETGESPPPGSRCLQEGLP